MFHQKADGITAFTASEAFIDFLGRRDGEGWGFFVVEWAKSHVVCPPLFELNEVTHYLDDVDATLNLLYGML